MRYVEESSGEFIKVYLFVACLPYSQYTYVEPTLNMKMNSWLRCHINMYHFFGGVPNRTLCDNLKTGVRSHPKEGEILLTEEYEALGMHYVTAIMPAPVRTPRAKASVEGNVGKIGNLIIGTFRNRVFTSFEELKAAVDQKVKESTIILFRRERDQDQKSFRKKNNIFARCLTPHLKLQNGAVIMRLIGGISMSAMKKTIILSRISMPVRKQISALLIIAWKYS